MENCLGLRSSITTRSGQTFERSKVATKLRDAEATVNNVHGLTTLHREDCRHERYRSSVARQELHQKILQELCSLPRIDDDDQIKLGVGGALPRTGSARSDRNAYIVTGLPASGKSTLVNKIADDLGAVIVDSDFAKRKFPEFDSSAGAQLVHEESALIVEGGDADEHGEVEPSLLGYCRELGLNIVMPKIGHNQRSIEKLRDALKSSGYHVHLTTVVLSRSQATVRALHRFLETSRYVPLGLVFDNYANDPALTYYKSRVSHLNNPSDWESFGALCSQTGKYKVLDCSNDTNPAAMFREAK